MRAAPAFSLTFELGFAERLVLATVGGLSAAAIGAWVWSHVDATAGFVGRGLGPWVAVVLSAAGLGAAVGWFTAPRTAGTIQWQQGQWSLRRIGARQFETISLEPMFDLGGWMLLKSGSVEGGCTRWLPVRRSGQGAAWHALRATLYAPGRSNKSGLPADGAPP